MENNKFRLDIDHENIIFRGRDDRQIDADRMKISGPAYFEISTLTITEVLAISNAYQTFINQIKHFEAAKGFKFESEDPADAGVIIGGDLNYFKFDTSRCFFGLDEIEIDGEKTEFVGFVTEVRIWSDGQGIDFRCKSDGEDFDIVFGTTRTDLIEAWDLVNYGSPTPKF